MAPVLGITGYKFSGKSEVRKYLVRSYGFDVLPMAAPLKTMLKALGLTEEQVNGSEKETPSDLLLGVTPRLAMQTLGTEWGRLMIHNDLWVSLWQRSAINCTRPVCADDVRFDNEVRVVRELGGKMIRVSREGAHVTNHASETEMAELPVDYTIINNGKSLVELHKAIDRALLILKVGR